LIYIYLHLLVYQLRSGTFTEASFFSSQSQLILKNRDGGKHHSFTWKVRDKVELKIGHHTRTQTHMYVIVVT